jgi:hypothetical protein
VAVATIQNQESRLQRGSTIKAVQLSRFQSSLSDNVSMSLQRGCLISTSQTHTHLSDGDFRRRIRIRGRGDKGRVDGRIERVGRGLAGRRGTAGCRRRGRTGRAGRGGIVLKARRTAKHGQCAVEGRFGLRDRWNGRTREESRNWSEFVATRMPTKHNATHTPHTSKHIDAHKHG